MLQMFIYQSFFLKVFIKDNGGLIVQTGEDVFMYELFIHLKRNLSY